IFIAVCSWAFVASACGPSKDSAAVAEARERVRPDYDKNGRLTKLEYDSDGNGKIDTWGYMDGTRVVRVEVDEDGDGKVDRWEFHTAQGPQGSPTANGPQAPSET